MALMAWQKRSQSALALLCTLSLGGLLALAGCTGSPAGSPSRKATVEPPTTPLIEGALGDPSRAPAPAAIDRVRVIPKLLDRGGAAGGDGVRLALQLSHAADLLLEIHDGVETVRELEFPGRGSGPQTVPWDVRDAAGRPVAAGVYALRLETRNAAGTQHWGGRSLAAGEEILAQRLTYDRETRQMRFHLPTASYLQVQVRLRDFPHLHTPLDWEARPAGWHTVEWDGWDTSRVFALAEDPRLRFELLAYALPRHAVIVQGGPAAAAPSHAAAGRVPVYHSGADCLQAGNLPRLCRAPRFTLELPEVFGETPEGLPRVRGEVPVRIRLAPQDRTPLLQSRFEVMVFVDTEFWFEEEEGTHPLSFSLDTQSLPPGEHVLTVNVVSYDNRRATRSLRFYKEEEESSGPP